MFERVKQRWLEVSGSVHTEAYALMLTAIRSARVDNGVSQAQLAAKLGKPPSFVGKYELGERRLDVVELLVILKVLNVPRDLFFDQLTPELPAVLR